MIIAVDFDGTLVSQDRDYGDVETPLEFLPGAKEGILALKRAGHDLVLFSARSDPSLWEAWTLNPINVHKRDFDEKSWASSRELNQARHKQMMDFVRKELPGVFLCEYTGIAKPSGVDLYIDDRAMGAGGIDWVSLAEVWGDPEEGG